MSVYVDALMNWGSETAPECFRQKPSCHLYGDTIEELHRFAVNIGMRREWFQPSWLLPHYDLTPYMRMRAVRAGAVEQTRDQMVEFMRAARRARQMASDRAEGQP